MTKEERIQGNKLLAEFMDRALQMGTVSDFKENLPIDIIKKFRYHTSWDWQIPVFSKIFHLLQKYVGEKRDQFEADRYLRLCDKYESATFTNNPTEGFKILVEAIKWYKENK